MNLISPFVWKFRMKINFNFVHLVLLVLQKLKLFLNHTQLPLKKIFYICFNVNISATVWQGLFVAMDLQRFITWIFSCIGALLWASVHCLAAQPQLNVLIGDHCCQRCLQMKHAALHYCSAPNSRETPLAASGWWQWSIEQLKSWIFPLRVDWDQKQSKKRVDIGFIFVRWPETQLFAHNFLITLKVMICHCCAHNLSLLPPCGQ